LRIYEKMKKRIKIVLELLVIVFVLFSASGLCQAHKYNIGDTVMWSGPDWEKAPLNGRILGTIIDIKYDVPYSLSEGPNAENPTHYFDYYIINFAPYYQEGAQLYDNWCHIEFLDRNTELFKSETPIPETTEETPAFEAAFTAVAIMLIVIICVKRRNIEGKG